MKIIGCLALLALLVLTPVSYGQIVWSGSGSDSEWSTPENWTGGSVPSSAENAQIGIGGVATITDDVVAVGSLDLPGGEVTLKDSSITIDAGLVVGPAGSFTQDSNSNVSINTGGINLVGGGYTLSEASGLLNLNGGDIVGNGMPFNFNGGTLAGMANYDNGDLLGQQAGTFEVGSSTTAPSKTSISGAYSLSPDPTLPTASGIIAFEVGGDAYDVLDVDGAITILPNSVIDVTLLDTFSVAPAIGDMFDIMLSSTPIMGADLDSDGILNPLDLDSLTMTTDLGPYGGGFVAMLTNNGNTLSLMYVPEPSSMLLASIGILSGLALLRLKRGVKARGQ